MTALATAELFVAGQPRVSRQALVRLLDEFESLILTIRTDVYVRPTDDSRITIGRRIAECLDRIDSLVSGGAAISYATAPAALMVDPVAALRKIRSLRAAIAAWRRPMASAVRVTSVPASAGDFEAGWSTIATELAFIVSETIEAQRSIASLLARLGSSAPEGFGTMPVPALSARTSAPPSWALWERLDQIGGLLLELPPAVYSAPVEGHFSGTIGEHVRHCLDHVSALLSADASGTLSYDRRRRGTPVETDASAALQQILRLKAALTRWSARSLDEPIRVSSLIGSAEESISGWSTFGRELAFVLSHTIHHQATIAAVLALHGVEAPAGFGYAPSTPRRG